MQIGAKEKDRAANAKSGNTRQTYRKDGMIKNWLGLKETEVSKKIKFVFMHMYGERKGQLRRLCSNRGSDKTTQNLCSHLKKVKKIME